jgi:hypothetical protein
MSQTGNPMDLFVCFRETEMIETEQSLGFRPWSPIFVGEIGSDLNGRPSLLNPIMRRRENKKACRK